MENRTFLYVFLSAWLAAVVGVHAYALWRRRSQMLVLMSHGAASTVAVTMAYVFVFGRGSTVAQFAAGDAGGMSLWSLWVRAWPWLLLLCAGAGFVEFWVSAIACAAERWHVAVVFAIGSSLCALGFATVFVNFPDA